MKNLIRKKIKSFVTAAAFRANAAVISIAAAFSRSRMILSDNKGEGFVDTAVKILIAVVIGALLLAGLYLLFSNTILPTLTRRIEDMFNYRV
jgi:hypothetical protein